MLFFSCVYGVIQYGHLNLLPDLFRNLKLMDERKGDDTGVLDVSDHEQDMTENFITHWRKRNPRNRICRGSYRHGPSQKTRDNRRRLGSYSHRSSQKTLDNIRHHGRSRFADGVRYSIYLKVFCICYISEEELYFICY